MTFNDSDGGEVDCTAPDVFVVLGSWIVTKRLKTLGSLRRVELLERLEDNSFPGFIRTNEDRLAVLDLEFTSVANAAVLADVSFAEPHRKNFLFVRSIPRQE
jgi:hypothetical protein